MCGGPFDSPEIPRSGIRGVEEQRGWSGRRQLAEGEHGHAGQREVEQEPSIWTRGHGQAREISGGKRAMSADALLKGLIVGLSDLRGKESVGWLMGVSARPPIRY